MKNKILSIALVIAVLLLYVCGTSFSIYMIQKQVDDIQNSVDFIAAATEVLSQDYVERALTPPIQLPKLFEPFEENICPVPDLEPAPAVTEI